MARAVAPVVGVALLLGVTVLAAAVLCVGVLALDAPAEPARLVLSVAVDAATDRIVITPRAGTAVAADEITVRIAVDGRALAHQPPIQFFTARGFRAGPTGPFNRGADPTWSVGEPAGLRLASTNSPTIDPGDAVRVLVRRDDRRLGAATATAG